MSDVDIIEEIMKMNGYPDYPNLSSKEEKRKEEFFKKLAEKSKDKERIPIEF